MKKLISLIIILVLALCAISCSGEEGYPPIAQTDEEAQTVLTMTYDDRTYDVPYDIYRALFLNVKNSIDGGDSSVWTAENSAQYVSCANEYVFDVLTDIYAAFALCDELGYDMYSSSVEKQIKDYIKEMVDTVYLGDYDQYISDLKDANLNYSAQVLMIRYTFAEEILADRYIHAVNGEDIENGIHFGSEEYTKADVEAYYNSDECSRVLYTSVSSLLVDAKSKAEEIKLDLTDAAQMGIEDVKLYFGKNSSLPISEISNGILIGMHTLSSENSVLAEEAHRLNAGEVSNVLESAGIEKVYYVMYKMEKSEDHFEDNYSEIASIFLMDKLGALTDNAKENLTDSIQTSDFLKNLDHSKIKM